MNKTILKDAAQTHKKLILEPYDCIIDLQEGFEAICVFSSYFGGRQVYIPSVKSIFQRCLNEAARLDFRGDYASLSKKYGLSERHLRRVIEGS